jgi:hypothetical protein
MEKGGFSKHLNPTAWVRALCCNSVYITCYQSMHIPVSICTSYFMADKRALVDSGATDNFINANTTAPALASETAYITAFAHFLLSGPTPRSLCSAEPRRPRRALALSHALRTHLALYSALTLHTAAPAVHVLPHFLDISVPAHRTAFLHLARCPPGSPCPYRTIPTILSCPHPRSWTP